MRRRLMDFVTLLSLLLFVAVTVLWVRSYWRGNVVMLGRTLSPQAKDNLSVLSQNGLLSFYWTQDQASVGTVEQPPSMAGLGWKSASASHWASEDLAEWELGLGFGYSRGLDEAGTIKLSWLHVDVPYWAVFLPSGATAVCGLMVAAKSRGHERRQHQGQCPACAYDLRATPNRCPECGLVPVQLTASAPPDASLAK